MEITVTDTKTGGQPEVALNPAGWLAGVRAVLGAAADATIRPDPDDPWDPAADIPFTVTRNAIRYTLETYGLSTACSGGELARASGGVPVRGCSPSPLSSSIRQEFLKP